MYALAGGEGCGVEVLHRVRGEHLVLIILLELAGVGQPLRDEQNSAMHQTVHRFPSQLPTQKEEKRV